jgi:N-acetylated-alpha-linked acidic dipeptidase
MRLANASVLPVDFYAFYETVNGYTTELKALVESMRTESDQREKLLQEGILKAAADPMKPFADTQRAVPVPYLNFANLDNALLKLKAIAARFKSSSKEAVQMPTAQLTSLNALLYQAERSLLSPQGLPRRPWYRHQIYAPGFYTGYGVKTLPGIREGIEEKSWSEAQQYIDEVARVLNAYATQVQQAQGLIK